MGRTFQASFVGQAQGRFHGDESQGLSSCLSLRHDVVAPPSAPAAQSGGTLGGQLTIVKHWNVASPQLHRALQTGEELSVFLGWATRLPHEEAVTWYYTLDLTKAKVTRISSRSDPPAPGAPGDTVDVEEVSISYEQVVVHARDDLNWPAVGQSSAPQSAPQSTPQSTPQSPQSAATMAITPSEMALEVTPGTPGPTTAPEPSPAAATGVERITVESSQQRSGDRVRVSR